MAFELSFVRKYLTPRKKQLSVSLITLMSVGVIALVVWLLLLFLSVTEGIERSWLHKVTAINAPIRIQPTERYFNSYYYNADTFSASSHFALKTIGQKAVALLTDPHDPEQDASLPAFMPPPDADAKGLIDPVKRAYSSLSSLGLTFQDYEMSGAMMRLRLVRSQGMHEVESQLTQVSYLATLADASPTLPELLLPPLKEVKLSKNKRGETGILLAKTLQDNGVQVGDSGFFSYGAPTASSLQEQRIPIYVAGFYDPGVMAVGNRCILVPPSVTQAINASQGSYAIDRTQANGIMVWFDDLGRAEEYKAKIAKAFRENGIADFWKVTTFREYDFAKDLLQQFESDKMLFTLIGTIILIVACCNIISLLILLVSDKKKEIGILQAMGASKRSIAAIFGLSGAIVGLLGSLLGIGLAVLTLHEIDQVVRFLSFVQGHEAFNALFFGKSLPNTLSVTALSFVLIATPILAFLAGLIPAIQACRLKPSEILKSS